MEEPSYPAISGCMTSRSAGRRRTTISSRCFRRRRTGDSRRALYCLIDSWYATLKNLKRILSYGWHFCTRLKSNRLVNPDGAGNRPINAVELPSEGRVVHLKGYGFVKVFRTVSRDGNAEHWATNDLQMAETTRKELEARGWGIEVYHPSGNQPVQSVALNKPT